MSKLPNETGAGAQDVAAKLGTAEVGLTGGPPQISGDDPIAPQTHNVGGTYAQDFYDAAARRSTVRSDNYDPAPPSPASLGGRRSGFQQAGGEDGAPLASPEG